MLKPRWKRPARFVVTALVVICTSSGAGAEDWEPLETRKAADLQPAEILTGEHYRIGDAVETDGFLNFYDLQTDFGVYSADSEWELEIRLLEVRRVRRYEGVTCG